MVPQCHLKLRSLSPSRSLPTSSLRPSLARSLLPTHSPAHELSLALHLARSRFTLDEQAFIYSHDQLTSFSAISSQNVDVEEL